ncbi:hypothetical protein DFH09DRAFT_1072660 [Mycena vulgaris]|nr:hypothetical protein DFH09DRAFT_1072660 [Mycena vulgaris]
MIFGVGGESGGESGGKLGKRTGRTGQDKDRGEHCQAESATRVGCGPASERRRGDSEDLRTGLQSDRRSGVRVGAILRIQACPSQVQAPPRCYVTVRCASVGRHITSLNLGTLGISWPNEKPLSQSGLKELGKQEDEDEDEKESASRRVGRKGVEGFGRGWRQRRMRKGEGKAKTKTNGGVQDEKRGCASEVCGALGHEGEAAGALAAGLGQLDPFFVSIQKLELGMGRMRACALAGL